MKKHFYSGIIEVESLLVELDNLDLGEKERHHLADLIDSSLHHTILDAILSELSPEDKEIFLKHLSDGSHDKVWLHLNEKIENIEEKITKAADSLKQDLHKDIKEAKNNS